MTAPTLTFLFFGRDYDVADVKRHDIRRALSLPTDVMHADSVYNDIFKAYAMALEGEDRVTDDNFANIVERNITTKHPIMTVVYDGVLLFGDMLQNVSCYDDAPSVTKVKFARIVGVVKHYVPNLELLAIDTARDLSRFVNHNLGL